MSTWPSAVWPVLLPTLITYSLHQVEAVRDRTIELFAKTRSLRLVPLARGCYLTCRLRREPQFTRHDYRRGFWRT
jgi:hypothetical protein